MSTQSLDANGITISYETFGDPGDRPLLLVMGLGMQMLAWDEDFCRMLVSRGFWVIRFDNRDAGRSTVFSAAGMPDITTIFFGGDHSLAPYLISDMAGDAEGLLDGLGIEKAHVFGVSLGGMIAQQLAIDAPHRVLSLTSMMSTPSVGAAPPTDEAIGAILVPAAKGPDELADQVVAQFRVIGSPGFPFDELSYRRMAAEAWSRGYDPNGVVRQLAAIVASPDRAPDLSRLSLPALVIHGTADKLIPPSGGQATADAVANSELVLIEGLGHDLPREIWPRLVDLIDCVAERSGTPA